MPNDAPTRNAPELTTAVASWLAAEQQAPGTADDVDRGAAFGTAERALFQVFEALPTPSPTPGFADAVLARAGVVRARSRDLGVHLRFLVAAALVSTALASVVLVPTAWALLDKIGPATALVTIVQEVVALFAGALHATIALLPIGQGVATLARASWLIVTSPQGASFLLLLTALTFGLSRWLVALVTAPRSLHHATPA
ncbi:MAG: hypothetical protein AAGE94_11395 [Acidobacteriota bacterium]